MRIRAGGATAPTHQSPGVGENWYDETRLHIPFFSVVIPTKNRARLAAYALQSVLNQTFTDFEVIVCDNDDTEETADAIETFEDTRIRYHRTSGRLSMPDNWDLGLSLARGRFVTILSDRCVLKSYALQEIKSAIDATGKDVYVWGFQVVDEVFRVESASAFRCRNKRQIVDSEWLFDLFLHDTYNSYSPHLPKGLNSCCSNILLREIRRSTQGRVCLPVAPDHVLAFLILAHRSHVVLINQPLYLWWARDLSTTP